MTRPIPGRDRSPSLSAQPSSAQPSTAQPSTPRRRTFADALVTALTQSSVPALGDRQPDDRQPDDRQPEFESYAVPRIRGAVLDELRAQDWVPRTVRSRAREVARAREHLTVRLRRTATEREVADALAIGPRTLAEIGRLLGVTESRICQLHTRLVGRLRGALEELAVG